MVSIEIDHNNNDGGAIPKKSTPGSKRKAAAAAYKHDDTSQLSARKKKEMRIRLSLTRPSYVLGLCTKSLRAEHRKRLHYLVRKLVNRHDWVGASGVMSVYLKGTVNDTSPLKNRFKFWVLLELLKHLENHSMNSTRIRNLYDIWAKKIGSMKTWPLESRYAVQLEFMLFYLMQGNVVGAYQLALVLEQEKVDIDPVSKMMMGLTFYELWYSSSIPDEFKWRDLDQIEGQENSHTEGTSFSNNVGQSEWHNSVQSHMADSQYQCNSDSSVMNNRQISKEIGFNKDMIVAMDVDANHKREKSHHIIQPESFYMISDESQGIGDPSSNIRVFTQHDLYALGRVDLWLPLRFSDGNNLVEIKVNNYYNDAVKYLHQALDSTSAASALSVASAALLPLVQLLLIGGQVDDAITLLENQCNSSHSVLPISAESKVCAQDQRCAETDVNIERIPEVDQKLLIKGVNQTTIPEERQRRHWQVERWNRRHNWTSERRCMSMNLMHPLRVALLEHFDRNNSLLLSSCYEDILKKDPTCRDSIAKLIRMHQIGEYSLESLLENIALHLDATDAEYNTWKRVYQQNLGIFVVGGG
ncbi:hypothetical protein TSUD_53140 [Trifolium subterraneum]|uniref:Uncharacterized protein n=1 Tax=Trifolium subterraneum TaxID=3900 RepID=A0A2Z6MXV8_TRISU|nr:hypothetical protein TSUD_53140 [Trifolium subterraneum]